MKYNYEFFHRELLTCQSLNYERFKDHNEIDLFKSFLCTEKVSDYGEFDWSWVFTTMEQLEYVSFQYDALNLLFGSDGLLMPREKTVEILAYLRDHCREFYVTNDTREIKVFEKESARLISYHINQSKFDQYHGKFRDKPRPNLEEIALGKRHDKDPKLSTPSQAIANLEKKKFKYIVTNDEEKINEIEDSIKLNATGPSSLRDILLQLAKDKKLRFPKTRPAEICNEVNSYFNLGIKVRSFASVWSRVAK